MNSYIITVSGKVQGVYYRKSVKQNAMQNGYKGFVKNLANGNVEVGVMLDESNYDKFIEILKKGSAYSKVSNLDIKKSNEIYNDFTIRY